MDGWMGMIDIIIEALRPESIAIMREWMFTHLANPYPNDEQKRDMATRGGITVIQVNYWVYHIISYILMVCDVM
jgi:hypothetical protein